MYQNTSYNILKINMVGRFWNYPKNIKEFIRVFGDFIRHCYPEWGFGMVISRNFKRLTTFLEGSCCRLSTNRVPAYHISLSCGFLLSAVNKSSPSLSHIPLLRVLADGCQLIKSQPITYPSLAGSCCRLSTNRVPAYHISLSCGFLLSAVN